MPKKAHVRTLMDCQLAKGSERLLKSARQYLCHIFWSLWKEVRSINSVLVVSEILRVFVNILTPDEKYYISVKARVSHNQFKCNYLKTKKYFLNFLLHFWNLNITWNTLKNKISLRDISWSSYRLQSAGLLKCLKSLVSEHLWTVNMLKCR